jgi:replicative DNA helicase
MREITKTNRPERLPYNIEAEQQLLGALLADNTRLDHVTDALAPEMFYDPVHGQIYERIKARVEAGELASPVTLKWDFEASGALKDLGGTGYLVKLVGASISSGFRDYARLIVDLHGRRELVRSAEEAIELVNAGDRSTAELALALETKAGALASKSSLKPLVRSHLSALTGSISQINDAYSGARKVGVSTGVPALDEKLGFLRPGQLIVVAGRPAMGKSTVAQNIMYAAAMAGVGVFNGSWEMEGEEVGTRLISRGLADHGANIPYSRMIKGALSEDEMRATVEEAKRQQALPIYYGERDVRDLARFRSAVRRAQQEMAGTATPLGLVIVDYIQQMQDDTARSAYERASRASDACKSLARELGLPVVACAQLSREVERRDPPIPQLSDLRETGKLEEDADVVIFTYREAYYLSKAIQNFEGNNFDELADLKYRMGQVEHDLSLMIAKHRGGPTGMVKAFVDLATCHVMPERPTTAEDLI